MHIVIHITEKSVLHSNYQNTDIQLTLILP
jgi:hypothetical protein